MGLCLTSSGCTFSLRHDKAHNLQPFWVIEEHRERKVSSSADLAHTSANLHYCCHSRHHRLGQGQTLIIFELPKTNSSESSGLNCRLPMTRDLVGQPLHCRGHQRRERALLRLSAVEAFPSLPPMSASTKPDKHIHDCVLT